MNLFNTQARELVKQQQQQKRICAQKNSRVLWVISFLSVAGSH